jgi:hypothetical protein
MDIIDIEDEVIDAAILDSMAVAQVRLFSVFAAVRL